MPRYEYINGNRRSTVDCVEAAAEEPYSPRTVGFNTTDGMYTGRYDDDSGRRLEYGQPSAEPPRAAGLRYMKPDKFTGATSIETFLIQFEVCAEYNKWSTMDKAAQLKCCLSGPAAQILWDGGVAGSMSYENLVNQLKARFGAQGLQERFATELRGRRRRPNETITELHADVRRLMALAYPDAAQSSLGQIIARDHFVTALNDRELELKVRDRDPADLEAAFRAAVRIETHLRAYEADHDRENTRDHRNRRERYDEPRARQIGRSAEQSTERETDQGSVLVKVFAQLEKCQKEKEDMAKEMGRLKLLVEQNRRPPAASAAADDDSVPVVRPPWRQGRQQQPPPSERRNDGCFNCGVRGHYAKDCTSRRTSFADAGNARANKTSGDARSDAQGTETTPKTVNGPTDGNRSRPTYLRMLIDGEEIFGLMDSGADVTIIPTGKVGMIVTSAPESMRPKISIPSINIRRYVGRLRFPSVAPLTVFG